MRREKSPFGRSRPGLGERIVWLLVGLIVLRTWVIEGFPVPCRVTGGSMACTLLGEHCQLTCPDCGYPLVCQLGDPADDRRAVCPNCGYAFDVAEAPLELAGDRVLVDRTAWVFAEPRRWEVVAFRHPSARGGLAVKRVAGLPGELIQVRAGDVYVDGKIQRKTLRQQRAVRVLVYDADFRPRLEPAPPARWYGRTEASGWERVGGRLAHDAGPADRPIDWLVYGHWRRGGRPGEVVATPITDVCGYNQDRPRREEAVRPVRDVMLSFRIADTLGRGLLWLWATDGWEQFAVRVDPQGGSYTVLHSVAARQGKGQGKGTVPFSSDENRDSPQVIAAGKLPSALNGMTLEVSLFDQQFLLAMNGRPVAVWPYDRPDGAPPPPAEPLAIGSQGLGVVLQSLRVWRDVYYASPLDEVAAANLEKGFRLGGDEYFVLGDNSPISEDSRTWPEARTVAANMLIGRPILVIFPVGEFAWGGQHIQVPELGQIRYIR